MREGHKKNKHPPGNTNPGGCPLSLTCYSLAVKENARQERGAPGMSANDHTESPPRIARRGKEEKREGKGEHK